MWTCFADLHFVSHPITVCVVLLSSKGLKAAWHQRQPMHSFQLFSTEDFCPTWNKSCLRQISEWGREGFSVCWPFKWRLIRVLQSSSLQDCTFYIQFPSLLTLSGKTSPYPELRRLRLFNYWQILFWPQWQFSTWELRMGGFIQSQILKCRAQVRTDSQCITQLRSNLGVSGEAALQRQALMVMT